MKLTKNHIKLIGNIELLLGKPIKATALKRNIISIEDPNPGFGSVRSQMMTDLERICKKYNLGTVERNGASQIAVIQPK